MRVWGCDVMKNKKVLWITIFSLIACALHAAILQTQFNAYIYSSAFKVMVFILCPLIYCVVFKTEKFKDLISMFSMNGNKKNIKLAFALGAGVFTFIVMAFTILLPFLDREMIVNALAENGITPSNAFFVFLYIVVINAALEQFFFRGFVFLTLHRMNFKSYAHIYSSVLFAVYHVAILYHAISPGMLALCIAGLVVAGLIFNILAVRFKSIGGSLIVHISANMALNLMIGIHFVFGGA